MTRSACTWLAIATALLAPRVALADFEPVRPYHEVVDPPTPVRGHAVVGVSIVLKKPAMQSDSLWVRLRKSDKGSQIRADLASANGRLRGEGAWKFNPTESSLGPWYKLVIQPKAPRPERPEHFAVALQPEQNNPAKPTFLLTALGPTAPEVAPPMVRLYVNTRRADMFVYPPGKTNPEDAVRCRGIEGMQVVRFDAVCEFELTLGGQTEAADVTLVRRDGSQTSQQKIEIRW